VLKVESDVDDFSSADRRSQTFAIKRPYADHEIKRRELEGEGAQKGRLRGSAVRSHSPARPRRGTIPTAKEQSCGNRATDGESAGAAGGAAARHPIGDGDRGEKEKRHEKNQVELTTLDPIAGDSPDKQFEKFEFEYS
jgi:hypothetical protein